MKRNHKTKSVNKALDFFKKDNANEATAREDQKSGERAASRTTKSNGCNLG